MLLRRSYTLSLRDQGGMEHTVLLNSWANGAGRRDDGRPKSRVYVLEKVGMRRTAVAVLHCRSCRKSPISRLVGTQHSKLGSLC